MNQFSHEVKADKENPRPAVLLTQAKQLLRIAARDIRDTDLKSGVNGIATQLNLFINASAANEREETQE